MKENYSVAKPIKKHTLYEVCPYCKEKVVLRDIKDLNDLCVDFSDISNYPCERKYTGHRECTNPDCNEIFMISYEFIADYAGYHPITNEMEYTEKATNVKTYPKTDKKIEFNNVPSSIIKSFDEAPRLFL